MAVTGIAGGLLTAFVALTTGNWVLSFVALGLTLGVEMALGRILLEQAVAMRRLVGLIRQGDDRVESVAMDRDDDVGDLASAVVSRRAAHRQTVESLERSRDMAEARTRSLETELRRLETTASEYGSMLAACADGDLTRRLPTTSRNDAMRAIARSFNDALDEVEPMHANAQAFLRALDSASETNANRAREVRERGREINAAVETIAVGTTEQTEDLNETTEALAGLATATEAIASNTRTVIEETKSVARAGADGHEAARSATSILRQAREGIEQSEAAANQLSERIDRLDTVVSGVDEVATETELVALNANIEASKTDSNQSMNDSSLDDVAGEARSLAADVTVRMTEIDLLVEEVQADATAITDEIQATTRRIETALQHVEDALTELSDVGDGTARMNEGLNAVLEATDHGLESTESALARTNDVLNGCIETASAAETIARASDAQLVSIASLERGNDAIATRAQELSTDFAGFIAGQPVSQESSVED
jgi:methyl-accepting chemotaxis protein